MAVVTDIKKLPNFIGQKVEVRSEGEWLEATVREIGSGFLRVLYAWGTADTFPTELVRPVD